MANEEQRIQNMFTVIQVVVTGDFSQRIGVIVDDELAPLEVGINLMVDGLEELERENSQRAVILGRVLSKHKQAVLSLEEKIEEFEKFEKSVVKRELKIEKLKKEIAELKESEGKI